MTNRIVTIHLTPITEPITGDCPTCGFESLRWLRVYRLHTNGVTLAGEHLYCGRCKANER